MNEIEIQITQAGEDDLSGIQTVAYASWRETYAEIFSAEFIQSFLERYYAPEALRRAMQYEQTTFLVARHGGRVIGYCQFGPAIQSEGTELYRLYVLPEYWRRGVGRQLLEVAEAELRQQEVKSYACYVHARNEVGKGFYVKSGFVHDPTHDKPEEEEWYMVKHL